MNRSLPALAVLACAVAVISTAPPARADVAGIVRGSLTGPGGLPLVGITVVLAGDGNFTTVTGPGGRFVFPRVPFGKYTLRAATAAGEASATIEVSSDAVVDVALLATPVIGRTAATSTGVRGTPVSQNAFGARRLATMPRNDRLAAIVESVPGVVRFSYDEPVAHGFHGISYELDGAPLPQSTSSNFAQLIDPRDISAAEVFTGAFPAEFGGSRQGAVVNVVSDPGGGETRSRGAVTFGGGTQGDAEMRLKQSFTAGKARITLALNADRTGRGLDTPSRDAQHDDASTANQFVRLALPFDSRNLLAATFSAQTASFQIPISTRFSAESPIVAAPGTDDVQRENARFASVSFTHTSKDGQGYVRVVPWLRYDRISYLGDTANDMLATRFDAAGNPVAQQNGVTEDRTATYAGLRLSAFRASDRHALKAGIDLSRENFRSSTTIVCAPGNCLDPTFVDASRASGSQTGAYVEDKWSPNGRFAVNAGLRYDRSTGYTAGSQLSPRLEINQQIGRSVLHAYYGRLYAAPALEDTRRDAIVTQTSADAAPVYDLKPERDTYIELGIAHTFRPGLRGYLNAFDRTAVNVLDTTNLANTPLFVVFNNAVGRARGLELRLDQSSAVMDAQLSLTYSRAEAGGISGATFLTDPGSAHDLTLQPEDHDQRWTANLSFTRRFGRDNRTFVSLGSEYGTGFPVAFENGEGRLPAHWIVNAVLGRLPGRASRDLGYELAVENVFDHRYTIKVDNGFNTTQWNAPRRIVLRLTAPW
ncbi:MAG: hypothetical protein JWO66_2625 [Candidatus Eremiobacteraeota bacterium]|nr:hypothetical protein [Candidatus Eremiobacteraeota bacterium]